MGNPKRARSWKRRIQPRVGLKAVEPVLYSTHIHFHHREKSIGHLLPMKVSCWLPIYKVELVWTGEVFVGKRNRGAW